MLVHEVGLQVVRQVLLDEVTDISTSCSMTVTHAEQVTIRRLVEIWVQDEAILVNLVRVVWYETDPCREGILCDYVPFYVERLTIVDTESALILRVLSRLSM